MTKKLKIIMLTAVLSVFTVGCADISWQSPFNVGRPVAGGDNSPAVTDPDDIDVIEGSVPSNYRILSVVTGDSCQTRLDQPAASKQQALQFLREDAARFGADSVLQLQCYQLPKTADSRCYTQVSCFAKAGTTAR
ncbi:MAG: hypothetical protein COB75_02290 [Idiomarina sp.]|nr:hypothetical protein [Idiomarina sp.]PHQ77629.1 MAG: hypothetical protein COB75_02290 [Idiomarina sp.]